MKKRYFISVDIEGITDVTFWSETEAGQTGYDEACGQMTRETAAACRAVLAAGALPVVRDGHGGACNIRHVDLPEGTELMRGWACHPGSMMAGLDGIQNKIDPAKNGWGPYDFNLYTLSEEEQKKIKGLPKSLGEALDALEADHDYLTKGGVFPQRLIQIWVARKRAELKQMEQIPNPAEFKMYYDL